MSNARTRQLTHHSPLITRHGFFLLACLMLLCTRDASALDPSLDISQYAHTAWRIHDGFTKGAIFSIAQTPDGYLWLGTDVGLYRFDGVRAIQWEPPSGEQLPGNEIRGLLVAHDGALWISTDKGIATWNDGKLTNYTEVAGSMGGPLLEDHEGTVWFGLLAPGRLCADRGGKVECYGARSFGQGVIALYEDSIGNLWVSAATGLWRWKPSAPERYAFPRGVFEANSLIEDDGVMLLATNGGVKQLVGGKIQNYVLPGRNGQFRPTRLLHSRDGSLWMGSLQGLFHFHQGKADFFAESDGLSGDYIGDLFEDREANVWVCTTDGLDRFRDYAVPRISQKEGLSNSFIWSVQATSDGSTWLGTVDGLNRWANQHVVVYRTRSAPGESSRQDKRGGALKEITNSGLTGTPRSLGEDDRGRLWALTGEGLFHLEDGHFIRVPGVPGGDILALDGHGKVWMSNRELGLFYLTPGDSPQLIPPSQFGQKYFGPSALLPDRLRRGVWLGFYEGGILNVEDGQIRLSYTLNDGLGKGRVNDLRYGSRGTLWAATEGGLSRIRDGHITTLTSKNGLPCDHVYWSIEDDSHFIWLYMPCGLVRITTSELDAWVSDPKHTVQTTVLDASEGVRVMGSVSGYLPRVTKSPDGKIWFVSWEGAGMIDPQHLPFNKLPPPVHIEKIVADDKTYEVANGMGLPAQVRNLTIDYTALSLVVPEKVHFRYKLEGQDKDWREVVNNREVQYTNLAPKHYRFLVKACNNSGVWNEEGAALDFVIPPAWYQTKWFLALCVAAFLALLWALYQYRLHQLARQFNMRLEERVSERTRIARDLHDTLLQSFHGILLRMQILSNELPVGNTKEKVDTVIDEAEHAIVEGRDAVQGLRASTVERNDLAAAIRTLGEELAPAGSSSHRPEFGVQVEGTPRNLHPILRDEVYRIAGEAMRNAFHHADAQRIEVEIRYDDRQLRVRVRDDGKGIDLKLMGDGREGHFGLRGMRERAKLIGGKLTMWSELDSGTEVELTIPAARAYVTAPQRRRSGLVEKLAGKLTGKTR